MLNVRKKIILLDAREKNEYRESRIPGARQVGYRTFTLKSTARIPKDAVIVVYCSVGYRSARIAEKLKAAGYQKTYNLFGGIFAWANAGFALRDPKGRPTTRVHGYSKDWARWLDRKKTIVFLK